MSRPLCELRAAAAGCLALVAITACGSPARQPAAPVAPPEPVIPTAPLASAPPAAATWGTLRPTSAACRVTDDIEPGDIDWQLRTRIDAMPTMTVREGRVTAWLGTTGAHPGERRRPTAVVEISRGPLTLRGTVGPEDLAILLARPVRALDRFVADGNTNRPVLAIEADERLLVVLSFDGLMATTAEIECRDVSLRRRDLDLRGDLPAASGNRIVIRRQAVFSTDAGVVGPLQAHQLFGSRDPDGYVGRVHGTSTAQGQLVSLHTCGGLLYGYVPPTDILGPIRVGWGSSGRCPDTGIHAFAMEAYVEPTHRCAEPLPIYLETGTLADRVGTLAAGGPFRADEARDASKTLVTLVHLPVDLVETARFSVDTDRLDRCEEL